MFTTVQWMHKEWILISATIQMLLRSLQSNDTYFELDTVIKLCSFNCLLMNLHLCRWPAKLDMTKRTDLRHVKSTFSNTPPHRVSYWTFVSWSLSHSLCLCHVYVICLSVLNAVIFLLIPFYLLYVCLSNIPNLFVAFS